MHRRGIVLLPHRMVGATPHRIASSAGSGVNPGDDRSRTRGDRLGIVSAVARFLSKWTPSPLGLPLGEAFKNELPGFLSRMPARGNRRRIGNTFDAGTGGSVAEVSSSVE